MFAKPHRLPKDPVDIGIPIIDIRESYLAQRDKGKSVAEASLFVQDLLLGTVTKDTIVNYVYVKSNLIRRSAEYNVSVHFMRSYLVSHPEATITDYKEFCKTLKAIKFRDLL